MIASFRHNLPQHSTENLGDLVATTTQAPPGTTLRRPGKAFEWGMILVASWVALGAHLDAWAHNHGKVDASFFTPWHDLLYLGVFSTMGYLGIALLRSFRNGSPLRTALPRGYVLSFVGSLLFAGFGVFDLGWHTVFGIEADTAALFSPSHLGLMAGGFMIAAGPWVAARARGDETAGWPAVISAALALSMIWF